MRTFIHVFHGQCVGVAYKCSNCGTDVVVCIQLLWCWCSGVCIQLLRCWCSGGYSYCGADVVVCTQLLWYPCGGRCRADRTSGEGRSAALPRVTACHQDPAPENGGGRSSRHRCRLQQSADPVLSQPLRLPRRINNSGHFSKVPLEHVYWFQCLETGNQHDVDYTGS